MNDPKNKLRAPDGSFVLPVDGMMFLDRLMEHITDEVQGGVRTPKQIIEQIHDVSCYWLMNEEHTSRDEEDIARRRLN